MEVMIGKLPSKVVLNRSKHIIQSEVFQDMKIAFPVTLSFSCYCNYELSSLNHTRMHFLNQGKFTMTNMGYLTISNFRIRQIFVKFCLDTVGVKFACCTISFCLSSKSASFRRKNSSKLCTSFSIHLRSSPWIDRMRDCKYNFL